MLELGAKLGSAHSSRSDLSSEAAAAGVPFGNARASPLPTAASFLPNIVSAPGTRVPSPLGGLALPPPPSLAQQSQASQLAACRSVGNLLQLDRGSRVPSREPTPLSMSPLGAEIKAEDELQLQQLLAYGASAQQQAAAQASRLLSQVPPPAYPQALAAAQFPRIGVMMSPASGAGAQFGGGGGIGMSSQPVLTLPNIPMLSQPHASGSSHVVSMPNLVTLNVSSPSLQQQASALPGFQMRAFGDMQMQMQMQMQLPLMAGTGMSMPLLQQLQQSAMLQQPLSLPLNPMAMAGRPGFHGPTPPSSF